MEAAALTFGILGFVFGLVAVSEVNNLKKELQRLKRNPGARPLGKRRYSQKHE